MIDLPTPIRAMTERQDWPRATEADLETIRGLPPLEVPTTYLEFISRFGYLQFDPLDDPCEFEYEYREPEMSMTFSDAITSFMPASYVQRYYQGLVLDQDIDLPKFPAFFLPICFTPSQSHILLECGGESDRVWFWEFQGDAWGEGTNVRLGFVAQTFEAFLGKLRVPSE